MARRKSVKKVSAFEITLFVIMAIYSLILLTLFIWGFISSFRPHFGVIETPLKIFDGVDLKNYQTLFKDFAYKSGRKQYGIVELFGNSMLYAFLAALSQTLCTAIVAYVTTKYPSKFSSFIGVVVVIVTILPIVGNLPSMILITRDVLGVYGSIIGAVLMKFGFATVYYFIFCAAFKKISWEYAEAAFIDGASHFRVFFTIMLPLVSTLFGTIFILNFISYWNDFDTPYMFLKDNPTLSVGLFALMTKNNVPVALSNSMPILLCAAFVVFLPVLILLIIFRNKIIGNLDDGGIKG